MKRKKFKFKNQFIISLAITSICSIFGVNLIKIYNNSIESSIKESS